MATASRFLTRSAAHRAGAPLSSRLVDLTVLILAAWTLSCHGVVLAGGDLFAAMSVFPLLSLLLVGSWWRLQGVSREPERPGGPIAAARLRARDVVMAVGGLAMIAAARQEILLVWWLVAGLLAVGVFRVSTEEPVEQREPLRGRRAEGILWVVAVLSVAMTLVCHRPDDDDAFYLNVAVAAADQPGETLYADDTMHGIVDASPYLSIYRLHSYELLNGAFSFVTGIPVSVSFYLVSASFFALLVPLAWARLFRLLEPEHWPIAVVSLALVLALIGEEHRWYGNFSFVRIWQGKSIMISVALPLILAYAIDLGSRASPKSALLLACSLVAAVGLSSSGLWLAPTLATLGLISTLTRWSWKRLALSAALIAAYTAVMGLKYRVDLKYITDRIDGSLPPGDSLSEAFAKVLGDGRLAALVLGVTALSWLVASPGLGRRFAAIAPAFVWLTLLNPYTSELVSGSLTGPSYWRALWALPLPALLALAMASPFRLATPSPGLIWLLSLVILLGATARFGPSVLNQNLFFDYPGLKVEREAYRAAKEVVRVAVPATHVVAPPEVNVWIPTFHDRPYPLLVRTYLRVDDPVDREQRKMLTEMAKSARYRGRERLAAAREALDRFRVTAVSFRFRHLKRDRNLRKMLRGLGFQEEGRLGQYETWSRRSPPAGGASRFHSQDGGGPR